MTDPAENAGQADTARKPSISGLADGEWHRLHPATPLLRGGIAFLAIIGVLIANLRDRVIEFFLQFEEEDPVDVLINRGFLIPALLIAIGVLLLFVGGFYLAWRMHRFRVTPELVEVRSGIMFRTQRQGRLDRIQGVNIERPFIPRLFGAARLQIAVAGNDSGVKLDYLRSADADQLRRDVLRLASGVREAEATEASSEATPGGARTAGVIDQRVNEFLAPNIDPNEAEPESIVHLPLKRLLGSMLIRDSTIILLVALAIAIPWMAITDSWLALVGVIPGLIGLGGYTINRFLQSLRYSIAGTRNGIRVGYGLLSTTNETLPPGRVHAIEVSQPLLWRIPDWWQIKITRASTAAAQGGASSSRSVILPVGTRDEVRRVLGLLLPSSPAEELDELVGIGLVGQGGDDEYLGSTRRARAVRWFSWRRNGFRRSERLLFLRKGRIWRSIAAIPLARMQSIAISQGPIYRAMGLAKLHPHTVAGPILTGLGGLDMMAARDGFADITAAIEHAGAIDRTQRWSEAIDGPLPTSADGAAVVSVQPAAAADGASERSQPASEDGSR